LLRVRYSNICANNKGHGVVLGVFQTSHVKRWAVTREEKGEQAVALPQQLGEVSLYPEAGTTSKRNDFREPPVKRKGKKGVLQ